jgi:hypothetical protein
VNSNINEALVLIKEAISCNRFNIIPRFKNNEGMLSLGITRKILESVICGFTQRNYCSGPEDDRDQPGTGEIWLYGEDINGIEAYIKIKLYKIGQNQHAKCISIHPAVHPMNYQNR